MKRPVARLQWPTAVTYGYTLIELLVVLGIIGILAGIGIASIQTLTRKGVLQAQTQLLRSLLRRARNTAREERYPATIHFDYKNNEITARTRETLAFFRFENDLAALNPEPEDDSSTSPEDGADDDGADDDGADEDGADEDGADEDGADEDGADDAELVELAPVTLTGALNIEATAYNTSYVIGKVGTCLLFGEPAEASTFEDYRMAQPSHVEVEERPSLNPVDGIFIEVWVQPGLLVKKITKQSDDGLDSLMPDMAEEETPFREAPPRTWPPENEVDMPVFTIVRKGKAYELSMNADNSVEVVLTGPDSAGEIISFAARTRPDVIREEKWARLGLAFDGHDAVLYINGIERSLTPLGDDNAELPVRLITSKAKLRISDPNPRRSFYGAIDEVRIAGLIRGNPIKMPAAVTLVPGEQTIRFDALGQLDPLTHSQAITIQLSDDPDLLEKLFPGEDRGSGKKTELRKEDDKAELDQGSQFRNYLRRARRFLKTVDPKGRREVVVDMHGTLR
jgi:prepilin-type N-terminal cleavage/methylation domain-containing protein